jgi:C-terminal processing protease CtpA/Prc
MASRRKVSPSARRRSRSAASPPNGLRPVARRKLIETALDLIETLYVHLPLKRSMYAVNPLQRLKLLRRRTELQKPPMSDREFFDELLSIFCQLRDLHTSFVLPEPFRSSTAFLPFRLERCFEETGEIYVVSQLMEGQPIDAAFQVGSVITHWNGTPIRRVVAANADREAGSNPAARFAQGLTALTIRWLGQSILPDEEWVDLVYQPKPGKTPKNIRFKWQVFQRRETEDRRATSAIARAQGPKARAVGMDARGESERQIRSHLFAKGRKQGPRVKRFGDDASTSISEWAREVFPTAGDVHTKYGVFAYVRIATFNVDDEEKYIAEFISIVSQLSQKGLILDVRGNGGGLILFGERLLQLLTPRPIDPVRFSFLNSTRTQSLTGRNDFIAAWRDSIGQSIETGADYSQGFPLEPIDTYNGIGQKYQGPIVLVTDALCYSTTDIFAAGFQDHQIGIVLGVDETTGAGGANVWEYPLIAQLLKDRRRFPDALPQDSSFRFAVRRVTRVGKNSGVLLEDLGVKADALHRMTRRDVLERNIDLIERAGKILKKLPVQRLVGERKGDDVQVSYVNLDRIDAYLDDRPLQESLDVKRSPHVAQLVISIGKEKLGSASQLRLEGFRSSREGLSALVAATRVDL